MLTGKLNGIGVVGAVAFLLAPPVEASKPQRSGRAASGATCMASVHGVKTDLGRSATVRECALKAFAFYGNRCPDRLTANYFEYGTRTLFFSSDETEMKMSGYAPYRTVEDAFGTPCRGTVSHPTGGARRPNPLPSPSYPSNSSTASRPASGRAHDALGECLVGDDNACGTFADQVFGAHLDGSDAAMSKFARPGAYKKMDEMCDKYGHSGPHEFCLASMDIHTYEDLHPDRWGSGNAGASLRSCASTNTSSRKVYNGYLSGSGDDYHTVYDTSVTNVCGFRIVVNITGAVGDVELDPNETYSGSNIGVGAVRRAGR